VVAFTATVCVIVQLRHRRLLATALLGRGTLWASAASVAVPVVVASVTVPVVTGRRCGAATVPDAVPTVAVPVVPIVIVVVVGMVVIVVVIVMVVVATVAVTVAVT
jgi:hypothetical protein